jgi:exopolysaccharide biosynthesis protein
MKRTSTKKTLTISLACVLIVVALAATACGFPAASAASGGTTAVTQAASASQTTSTALTLPAGQAVAATTSSTAAAPDYTATDNSYTSATRSFAITEVASGSGYDKVTYYIADVQLTDGTDLESAFSSGTYGGKVQDTSTIAEANNAIVAINGDYYSARKDGIVIRNGMVYQNLPARTGLAIYRDGTMKVYDETATSVGQLLLEGVRNTFSFGPGLLVDGAVPDDIGMYEAEVNARHAIQGLNPRTGVGMIDTNHFVFVVVDGRSPGHSRGVTLEEFAQIFRGLGCTTAYNLDGGGSSTLYFMGKVVNNPSERSGERAVSDILFVD